jgi:hypothetical protein
MEKEKWWNSLKEGEMWHLDLLLGNDRKIRNYTTAVASNGFTNKHVSTATDALQQGNRVFCMVCAKMLHAGSQSVRWLVSE